MENENKTMKAIRKCEPVCLHLELDMKNLSDEETRLLQMYGGLRYGKAISRDILIPDDMPLNALHYTIQKLFGWRNSHLRRFILPKKSFDGLVQDKWGNWVKLVGALFRIPIDSHDDFFWNDDFKGESDESFITWLKSKYTGPYKYQGYIELYDNADYYMKKLIEDVKVNIPDFNPLETDSLKKLITDNYYLYEIKIYLDILLERLEVTSVLAEKGQKLHDIDELGTRMVARRYQPKSKKLSPEILPVTHKIIYNYDYGDDWNVIITRPKDFSSLVKTKKIIADDLDVAKKTVSTEHRPVCVLTNGGCVLDDVGGIYGYNNMLNTIFGKLNKRERSEMLHWAFSQGWDMNDVNKPVDL